eukprot:Skav229435  [mRNA]  locus=scaffold397:56080:58631:+ [translate_table: standard]
MVKLLTQNPGVLDLQPKSNVQQHRRWPNELVRQHGAQHEGIGPAIGVNLVLQHVGKSLLRLHDITIQHGCVDQVIVHVHVDLDAVLVAKSLNNFEGHLGFLASICQLGHDRQGVVAGRDSAFLHLA